MGVPSFWSQQWSHTSLCMQCCVCSIDGFVYTIFCCHDYLQCTLCTDDLRRALRSVGTLKELAQTSSEETWVIITQNMKYILKEILKALSYMDGQFIQHGDVKGTWRPLKIPRSDYGLEQNFTIGIFGQKHNCKVPLKLWFSWTWLNELNMMLF